MLHSPRDCADTLAYTQGVISVVYQCYTMYARQAHVRRWEFEMVSTPNPNDDRPVTMADLRWFAEMLNKRIDDLQRSQFMLFLLVLALMGGMVSVMVAVFG